jgi:hypothetical protein
MINRFLKGTFGDFSLKLGEFSQAQTGFPNGPRLLLTSLYRIGHSVIRGELHDLITQQLE